MKLGTSSRCARALALSTLSLGLLGASLLSTSEARAEDPPAAKVKDLDLRPKAEEKKDGFFPSLMLDGQFSINDNRGVVGQPDGTALTFGHRFETGFLLVSGMHEWDTNFIAAQALTKTQLIDELIRSRDIVDLASSYLIRLKPWVGPYIRLNMTSQALKGADVRPGDTLWRIARVDGTSRDFLGRRLALTDNFQPFTIKEALGVFLEPIEEKWLDLDFKLGGAGQHVLANGQLAVTDDAATADVVEVTELRNINQIGIELLGHAEGKIKDDLITYKVHGELMLPLLTDPTPAPKADGSEKTPLDLLNINALVGLRFKLASFASLDYELRVVRQPAVVDLVQVQNNLLLSLGVKTGVERKK